jgi:hypothetical protein
MRLKQAEVGVDTDGLAVSLLGEGVAALLKSLFSTPIDLTATPRAIKLNVGSSVNNCFLGKR